MPTLAERLALCFSENISTVLAEDLYQELAASGEGEEGDKVMQGAILTLMQETGESYTVDEIEVAVAQYMTRRWAKLIEVALTQALMQDCRALMGKVTS